MNNIFVFTQNLILESLKQYINLSKKGDKAVFITTHFLFENERAIISNFFDDCVFKCFADFLTDEEMAKCDLESYTSTKIQYDDYLANIKKNKNKIIIDKVLKMYPAKGRYIFSKDLGIDFKEWNKVGFRFLEGEYYYKEDESLKLAFRKRLCKSKIVKKIYHIVKKYNCNIYSPDEVRVAFFEGRKYVFLGKMNRIGYRLDTPFEASVEECDRLNAGHYETKDICTYMTTWHEHDKCNIPDSPKYSVRWAQDGYLPPNYTHYDYSFKPNNVVYYCWDILGTQLFKNKNLPFEMIPFRKKLYIPQPKFPSEVKNVLIVASGSGDWTALKNRSDDDIMVDAFVQMARRFPNMHFTYRCHPTWVHPLNVGVNAINRVNEYFKSLGLKNLTLSSNMPVANEGDTFQYSFSRSSLEDDLKKADFVFGEHSVSMIDAAFKAIPFASVNITKRRNFFIGINNLGFPTCTSHDEIAEMLKNVDTDRYQKEYLQAVENYNRMTDEEI